MKFDMNRWALDLLRAPHRGALPIVSYPGAEMCAAGISDRPTLGCAIGPFSLAGHLLGVHQLMLLVRRAPGRIHALLARCTGYVMDYLRAFKEAGVNGVIVAEPTAGLLSASMAADFAFDYLKRIVESVQDSGFMVVLHNCGNATPQVEPMVATGARAFHFGNAVDLAVILSRIPPDRLAMGNIDPSGVMSLGTPAAAHHKVLDVLSETAAFPNFVLSTGCDLPPGSPLANLEAFYAGLARYNRSRGNARNRSACTRPPPTRH